MTRISAHTLGGNLKSFCEVNQKFKRFLLFFSIPRHTKGNQAVEQNRAGRCVSRRANPLYESVDVTFTFARTHQKHHAQCLCTRHFQYTPRILGILDDIHLIYRLYQNNYYWDIIEFSDFFQYFWTNWDLYAYRIEISIALSFTIILVYVNSTFRREFTCYKEMMMIFTVGFGTLD